MEPIQWNWAVKNNLDKTIRFRLPAQIVRTLYQIKAQTGLTISEIIRLMMQDVINNPNRLHELFLPYIKKYQKSQYKKQKYYPKPHQDWERI
jgi:antitoxin component of RelBE/YafQ-DinJ toxin-antitoxin module